MVDKRKSKTVDRISGFLNKIRKKAANENKVEEKKVIIFLSDT